MFRSPRWRMLPLAAAGLFAAGCINIFPAPKPKTTNSNTTESEPTQVVNAEAVAAVALGKTAEPQAIPHAAKGLYGQSLGEKTIPAEGAPKSAPLRARKSDSLYTLAKPRIEAKKFDFRRPPRPGESREVIAVDWVRTFEGENEAGTSILVRAADGQDRSTSIGIGSDERAGTIALQTVSSFGPFSGGKLPKDVELYLVRTETRYGSDFQRTFKVSNSVILGETQFPITLARDWTEEEIAKLRNAPPKPPKWLTGASTDPAPRSSTVAK